ncbi:SDR family NAD(P)-dependent oxidoreductase [Meridianimarinicoccus marinus]
MLNTNKTAFDNMAENMSRYSVEPSWTNLTCLMGEAIRDSFRKKGFYGRPALTGDTTMTNQTIIAMLVRQAIIPHLRNYGTGTIINISSMGGNITFPLGTLDHGSKFAAEGLSEALFFEMAAIGVNVKTQELPLLMARALDVEVFSPPLFAAVCSPDLRHAARRVARYKALTGPVGIEADDDAAGLTLRWTWPPDMDPPQPLLLCELMFWCFIAQECTRLRVDPLWITLPHQPRNAAAYEAFFRTRLRHGAEVAIRFAPADARLPFLTVNDAIWGAFEPELRRQQDALAARASMSGQVRDVLLRAIPAACATADHVAAELSVSPRTLQRRLQEDGTSFKALVNATRSDLARHYLLSGDLPLAEISFLLGYRDPSSFNRAFRDWTGTTPDRFRKEAPALMPAR